MKNIFKNLNTGALTILVAVALITISWTESKISLAPQWYQVSVSGSDPDPEKNQHILGLFPGSTPGSTPGAECNTSPGEICAVEMDLQGAPIPATISDANALNIDTSVQRQKQD